MRGFTLAGAVLCGLFALLALCIVLALPAPGRSLDGFPVTPDLSSWYARLVNLRGELCCSVSDCRPTSIRMAKHGHYEALIDKRYPSVAEGVFPAGWYTIPDWATVPKMPNPIGEPVVCFYGGAVHCLVLGAGT